MDRNSVQNSPFRIHRSRLARAGIFPAILACLCSLAPLSRAVPVPAPEKLLPEDTLLVVTAPDFPKLRDLLAKSPQGRFWNDAAMKPFKDNFTARWKEELTAPLQRDLNMSFDSYSNLLQGQLTFAVTQNGWQGTDQATPGLLLLLDAKDKRGQLKNNLAELRRKWVDAGKVIRTEKIRDVEFLVLPMASNNVPKTVRKFFPKSPPVHELGAEVQPEKPAADSELVIGQADSLLIIANSIKVAEKIVAHLSGGSAPALGDLPAYQANHLALFRDAPLYGWVNAKVFIDVFTHRPPEATDTPQAPNPFSDFLKPDKIARVLGLAGLKTAAFSAQDSNEGALVQFYLGVPETSRQALFKILAGEPKDARPPVFVPANVVRFQRWRLDGQKTWATLEKMLGDFSPEALGVLNFALDTANANAKEKDPGFDLRKSLIGNLGDDLITYEKAPRSGTPEATQGAPSLCLLGSPNAEQLAVALKSVLVFVSQQAGSPGEREFLGRKIFSVPLPSLSLPMAGGMAGAGPRTLNYAASGGYVAFSSDVSILEEYLRSSESQAKTLRELPGLAEAAQQVTGPGTDLFGYENRAETLRTTFENLKKSPGPSAAPSGSNPLPSALGVAIPGQEVKDWMDFSLLPDFDKVSKYFSFTVYGGSANVDGLTLKLFAPIPPQLKGAQGSGSAH